MVSWGEAVNSSIRLFQAGLIAIAVLVTYGGSLDNDFQYDDVHSLVENPHIRSLSNIPAFFVHPDWFSEDSRSAMYRPMVLVSYAVNYAAAGYDVWGYHAVNIIIHVGVGFLLCLLITDWTTSSVRGLVVSLLFALHPINSETVNYVSSRSESLCALFFLVSFYGYVRSRRPGNRRWYIVGLLAFGVALMNKSVAIALPAILLAFDFATAAGRGADLRFLPLLRRHGPYWLLGIGFLLVVRDLVDTALFAAPVRSAAVQLSTQCKAVIYYLKLLLFPQAQNVEHQFVIAAVPSEPAVVASALLLGSLLLVGFVGRRALPDGLFWLVWTLVILLPTLIIPLNVLVNEHRLYLPSVAFAVGLTAAFSRFSDLRFGLAALAGIALLAVYGMLAGERTQVWQSPHSLWSDSLSRSPNMPRPHLYVGDNHNQNGNHEAALAQYEQALTVYPEILSGGDLLSIYNNQGSTYLAMGRYDEAIISYRKALKVDSTYAKSREALEALLTLRQKQRDPGANALLKSGLQLLWAGRLKEAAGQLQRSAEVQPLPVTYHALAQTYSRLGRWLQAKSAYETVIALGPKSKRAATARSELRAIAEQIERQQQGNQ